MVPLSGNKLTFPPVESAPGDYPLAIGGDLSAKRLILAYSSGIFPWYSKGEPILWWSPDPRFVLFPDKARTSRSMKKVFRSNIFKLTFDQDFYSVIMNCKTIKRGDQGTWIMDDMVDAYCALHKQGLAHSVEVWYNEELVGGMYGVSLGRSFFGESMFHKKANASKFALLKLAMILKDKGFDIIDCQVHSAHLESLGAEMISRKRFCKILDASLKNETIRGNWQELL